MYDSASKEVSFFNNLSVENFLADYWRKRPLLIKAGAREFLDLEIDRGAFDKVAGALRDKANPALKEQAGEVTFVEGISSHIPKLQERANQLSQAFGTPHAWFDATHTMTDDNGLGEHFDHSDNFVILLEGSEHWLLSPPASLAREKIAQRMSDCPGIGAAPVSEEGLEKFELEAGDVLYIPLFWVHSGLSRGSTFSLSFTVPALSLQAVLTKALGATLRDLLLGYQPVPFLGASATDKDRASRDEMLKAAAKTLLARTLEDDTMSALSGHMTEVLERRAG